MNISASIVGFNGTNKGRKCNTPGKLMSEWVTSKIDKRDWKTIQAWACDIPSYYEVCCKLIETR